GHSSGNGSLTFTTMSDRVQIAVPSLTISAPCWAYCSSLMPDPDPAPVSISTACPPRVSSSTPTGVMATRYSSVLTSLGTPTIMSRPRPRVHLLSQSEGKCGHCEIYGDLNQGQSAGTGPEPAHDARRRVGTY